jgi:hypothetical protein
MLTAAGDPDLNHLYELLRMLPGPREHPEFWTAVQHQYLGEDTALKYVYEKMTLIPRTAKDPTPQHISDLARYLLAFFAGDNPELWDILSGVGEGGVSPRHDTIGRWWAEDLCQTAWTLYVRYSRPAGNDWLEKWQYQKSYQDWLPPRTGK